MKIALIGHGAMGKLIGRLAEEKGHEIAVVIDDADAGLSANDLATKLNGVDVAIDFTTADAVRRNVEACVAAGVPLVEGQPAGTTGRMRSKKLLATPRGVCFRSQFSIGVNIFYRIADHAAELLPVSRIRSLYRGATSFP